MHETNVVRILPRMSGFIHYQFREQNQTHQTNSPKSHNIFAYYVIFLHYITSLYNIYKDIILHHILCNILLYYVIFSPLCNILI